MAIDLKKFEERKKAVDRRRSEAERAAGAMEPLKRRLAEMFGCTTPGEARQKLTELEATERATEEAYVAAEKEFDEQWAGKY